VNLPEFLWLSQSPAPPARWDLRLLSWRFDPDRGCRDVDGTRPCLLDWREGMRPDDWGAIRHPQVVVALGAERAEARASLLKAGFGDALGTQVALVELAARLLKLEAFALSLPRRRRAGPAMLDLFYRDARIDGTWLGLHPREFALLWRLAETPYARVSRRELLADVWRLEHVPATNSLEVHVSRLRAKLAISHCGWLVQTHPEGGYQLGAGPVPAQHREALDRPVAIGNGNRREHDAEERAYAAERSRFD
jgi:DNA-binding winged helix-turn-helix (wHTH) protein